MNDVRLVATNPVDSSLVPVATNSRGELAVQSPKIEKIPNDLDVEGDLNVSGSATINTLTVGLGGGSVGTNTVVGRNALYNNTTGVQNTAVGQAALNTNTTGSQNTAVGRDALHDNTEGEYNTALGRAALYTNNTGELNTAVGVNALNKNIEGAYNTAVGVNALHANTEGEYNTALGVNALYNNTTGVQNIAVGQAALYSNTEGVVNTAVGINAGYFIKGDNNTILGAYQGTTADASLNNTVIISAGPTKRMQIDSNGIATFSGDVVVASRGKQWMLVEQGGLCHMVQQVKATTAEYPPLRDVFSELNVIEKALEQVMEKLRMTAPDGWPVWDGSDNSQ